MFESGIIMKFIDMHCDTISAIRGSRSKGTTIGLHNEKLAVTLNKLRSGNLILQNFALFVDKEEEENPYQAALEMITLFNEEMKEFQDYISQVTSYSQISENRRNHKISALLTLEEGDICQGEIEKLKEFYQYGIRMMTITWNYENELAFPNGSNKGLKKKGFEFVEEMERMGMIIDVSHLSDQGFWNVVGVTDKPFVASHSNARELCMHQRNLTDQMITCIANRGGVIGVNFYGKFLSSDERSTICKIVDHMKYLRNIGGADCIAIGSDFDGFQGTTEIEDCSSFALLEKELQKNKFTNSEIEKICYKNVLRVYKELMSKS